MMEDTKYTYGDKFIIEIADLYQKESGVKNERPQTLYRMRHFDTCMFTDKALDKLQQYNADESRSRFKKIATNMAYTYTVAKFGMLLERLDHIKAKVMTIGTNKAYRKGYIAGLERAKRECNEIIAAAMAGMTEEDEDENND